MSKKFHNEIHRGFKVAQPSPKLMNANNVNNGWKQLDYKWTPSSDEEFGCNAYKDRTHFRPCLFNLSADPNEHKNLAEAHPDISTIILQKQIENFLLSVLTLADVKRNLVGGVYVSIASAACREM